MAIVPLIPSPHMRVEGPAARQTTPADGRRNGMRNAAGAPSGPAAPSSFQAMVGNRLADQRQPDGVQEATRRGDERRPGRSPKSAHEDGGAYAPIAPTPNQQPSAPPSVALADSGSPNAEAPALAPQIARLAEIARALKNNTPPQDASPSPATGTETQAVKGQTLPKAPHGPAMGHDAMAGTMPADQSARHTGTQPATAPGGDPDLEPALGDQLTATIRRLAGNPDMAPKTIKPPDPSAQGGAKVATDSSALTGNSEGLAQQPLFAKAGLSAEVENLISGAKAPHGKATIESVQAPIAEPSAAESSAGQPPPSHAQALRMATQTYLRHAAQADDAKEPPPPSGATSSSAPVTGGWGDGMSGALRTATAQNVPMVETPPPTGSQEGMVSTIMDQVRQTLKVYPEKNAATFNLRPPELGPIRIEIIMGPDNTVRTVIQAQTAQGQEALQRNAAQLHQEFQRQGLPEPDLQFGRDAHPESRQSAGNFDHQRQEREWIDPSDKPAPRKAPAWNARDPAHTPRIRGPAKHGLAGRINLMV